MKFFAFPLSNNNTCCSYCFALLKLYHELTPHLMTPSETCMEELLRMIELQDGYSHLPVIWSDFAWFHFTRKEGLVDLILQIMSQHKEEVCGMCV